MHCCRDMYFFLIRLLKYLLTFILIIFTTLYFNPQAPEVIYIFFLIKIYTVYLIIHCYLYLIIHSYLYLIIHSCVLLGRGYIFFIMRNAYRPIVYFIHRINIVLALSYYLPYSDT